jgi:hypothetical protein
MRAEMTAITYQYAQINKRYHLPYRRKFLLQWSRQFHEPVLAAPRSASKQPPWVRASTKRRPTMLHCNAAKMTATRAFSAPMPCPHCGDCMVAPIISEFVAGDEIRHHWECEACGESSTTAIPLEISGSCA